MTTEATLSFNPCFGGFCSKTHPETTERPRALPVSILVLVDFALKPIKKENEAILQF